MNKIINCISLTLLLLTVFAAAALAEIEWQTLHTIQSEAKPIDIASTVDGKWIYVLTDGGKISVYSDSGVLEDTLDVGQDMDRIAVSGLSVAGIPDKLVLSSSKTGKIQEIILDFVVQINTKGAPFMGPPDMTPENAPVVLTVFSDFQCPACARLKPLMEQVTQQYPTSLVLVFKHFPLPNHPKARPAAWAAMAAHQQGKFWAFHDLLFENQNSLTDEKYEELAKKLDLDINKFKKDSTSLAIKEYVGDDFNEGRALMVSGTPSLYVNGRKLKSNSAAGLKQIIDRELAKPPKK
ncbi:MAG: DsbA family protein [Proteobacteria bacterium]|nr:DsbA family protein [Pseudomonadota bacterium]MBU1710576.1 DsbA family protein [Pseudomonadota bacterium]